MITKYQQQNRKNIRNKYKFCREYSNRSFKAIFVLAKSFKEEKCFKDRYQTIA